MLLILIDLCLHPRHHSAEYNPAQCLGVTCLGLRRTPSWSIKPSTSMADINVAYRESTDKAAR